MSPELRHLRYFVSAAHELNFTRAAASLPIAQQALSAAIRQLEDDLDVRLFERTTRQVVLTPAGAALLPRAQRLLALADDLFEGARTGQSEAPYVRVDIVSSGLETGPAILRRLRAKHPDLDVRQIEYGVPAGLDALKSGALDVLFGNALSAPPDVAVELFRLEPFQVMLPADHPLAGREEVPVGALAEETWLLPSDDVAPEWVAQVVDMCQQAGFRPHRYRGVTHGSAAAAELVVERLCVVPTVAWVSIPAGTVLRPLTQPRMCFPWSMMWLEGQRTEAVGAVLEATRASAAGLGWLARVEAAGCAPPRPA